MMCRGSRTFTCAKRTRRVGATPPPLSVSQPTARACCACVHHFTSSWELGLLFGLGRRILRSFVVIPRSAFAWRIPGTTTTWYISTDCWCCDHGEPQCLRTGRAAWERRGVGAEDGSVQAAECDWRPLVRGRLHTRRGPPQATVPGSTFDRKHTRIRSHIIVAAAGTG